MADYTYFLLIVYTLSGKPNSTHDSADGEEDGKLNNRNFEVYFLKCNDWMSILRSCIELNFS